MLIIPYQQFITLLGLYGGVKNPWNANNSTILNLKYTIRQQTGAEHVRSNDSYFYSEAMNGLDILLKSGFHSEWNFNWDQLGICAC
jgi:hypothetical protein